MKIPFVDLPIQSRAIRGEVTERLDYIMNTCGFILGEEVTLFEKEFAAFNGVRHAIGVASGTDALHLAVREAGIGPGDEVLVPVNTFVATAFAVVYAGAKPVFVDVDEKTFNIDCRDAERRIGPKTKAVMPVHLCGQPADMDVVMALAQRRNLIVIEDACQAHGAFFKEKPVGTFGRSAGYSFYPGKNLGAFGDGGLVVTNDDAVAERIRGMRNYGQKKKYEHDTMGFNSRLDAMQAAVLRVKLKRLKTWNDARRKAAALYTELLKGVTPTPAVASDAHHVFHLYMIRVSGRERFMAALKEQGIETGIHYPVPLHLQKCFADLGYRVGDFPVAERLCAEIVSLPMFPEITEAQIRYVCDQIEQHAKG